DPGVACPRRWRRSRGCLRAHHARGRRHGGRTMIRPISQGRAPMGSGFPTLLHKELMRFWKVGLQTIAAPVVTALLYLLIFSHVLEDRVQVYGTISYTAFLIPRSEERRVGKECECRVTSADW